MCRPFLHKHHKKTCVEIVKRSATDRQIVLVNTARTLEYINGILPRIAKLEDTIHKLNHKLTMEKDTIQINAPDFDPDIDGPNITRAHNNAFVVSVQEQHVNFIQTRIC